MVRALVCRSHAIHRVLLGVGVLLLWGAGVTLALAVVLPPLPGAPAVPAPAASPTPTAPREVNFGRRLEPVGRQVIHGAGQSTHDFDAYFKAIGEHKPIIYMTYIGVGKKKMATELTEKLKPVLDEKSVFLIPQIGLSLGDVEKVLQGEHDESINAFCETLATFNRPAFVRIGYEFNGEWNDMAPGPYVQAWKRIVTAMRKHKLDQVATVWCYAPDGKAKNFMDYYPGDDWVDWWSIDVFDRRHYDATDTREFMAQALEHRFPVMIGESTPRRVGVLDGQRSWYRWYAGYFQFIRNHPHLKAFCYISSDWQIEHKDLQGLSKWGDTRIGENQEVLQRFQKELSDPLYLHGSNETTTRKSLGCLPHKPETSSPGPQPNPDVRIDMSSPE